MWSNELNSFANDIIKNAQAMKKSGKEGESAEVEEIAKEIEALAGTVVANMQNEGMFVATQIGHNGSSSPIYKGKL